MLYTSLLSRFELTTSVVIGTDCIGSCKSNYHTITATTAPVLIWRRMGVKVTRYLTPLSTIFQLYRGVSFMQGNQSTIGSVTKHKWECTSLAMIYFNSPLQSDQQQFTLFGIVWIFFLNLPKRNKSYFVKKKISLVLPKILLIWDYQSARVFLLTKYLLCLVDATFNSQSAFIWVPTMLINSQACSIYIRLNTWASQENPKEINQIL